METRRTPKGKIVSALRMLWLHSPERSEALKQADYKCEECGVKQSKAKGKEQKIQVHHKQGINNWHKIAELIQEDLLCYPSELICLCPECHKKEHGTN